MRYHGLDMLRGVAMLLGIVLHAMLMFQVPDLMGKVLVDAAESPPAAHNLNWALSLWIHIWRMPLFFMLAGFFAVLVIDRKGLGAFVQDRAIRIALTLFVFLALFAALIGRDMRVLDHLWFLWFLTLFCGLAAGMHLAKLRLPMLGPRGFLAVSLGLCVMAAVARKWGIWHHIPRDILDPEWQGFLMYFSYFALGMLLYPARAVFDVLIQRRVFVVMLGVGVVAMVPMILLRPFNPPAFALAPLSGLTTWAFSFGLTGAALYFTPKPKLWITRLVDAAYPVYLLHLYPTLGIVAVLIEAQVPQGWAILIGSVGGLISAVLLWLVFIRYTPVDWLLNGYAKAWFKWPFDSNGYRSKRSLT